MSNDPRLSKSNTFFIVSTVTLLYFLSAKLGLSLAIGNTNVSPVWPAAGIAMAAMLLFGFRVLPGVALGAFFSSFFSDLSAITSLGISIGVAAEISIGYALVQRFATGRDFLNRVENVLKFVIFAGVISTIAGAFIGTLTLIFTGSTENIPSLSLWSTWWLGDLMGILIVTPLILAWINKTDARPSRSDLIEGTLLVLSAVVVSYLVFSGGFSVGIALVYLTIPLAVCAAFRFGNRGATLMILIIASIAIWRTHNGNGPFLKENANESLLLLQVFLGSIQLTALVLGAALIERKSVELALRQAESKSRALVERVPAIVYQVQFGASVTWRYVSPRIKSILGFTPEEWTSDPQLWFKQVHPEDREEVLAKGMSSSLSGKPFVCEYRMHARDGRLIWFRDEGNVIRDPERKSAIIQGVMLDITERKRAEILQNVLYRLAENTNPSQTMEQYFTSVHESLSELIYARNFYIALYDSSTNTFTFPYSVSERSFSMDSQNAMEGLPGYVLKHGPLLADPEKLKELIRTKEIQDDGVPFVSWLGVPLKSNDRLLGVLSTQSFSEDQKYVYADLNSFLLLSAEVATTLEQKRAESALYDKTTQLESINRAMTVFLETNNWKEASHLMLRSALRVTDSEYGFIGVVSEGPVLRILAHEGLIWDQEVNRPFYEKALQTYQEKGYLEFTNLRNLFGSVITQSSPVISNDPDHDQRAAKSLPPGHPALRSFLGVPFHHASQVIGMIGVANRPGGYTRTDLDKVDFLSQTAAVLYHSYLQSQKQKSLQEDLRQSQKMEAVGRLAGGVAHDFNNLLMAITGYCELLLLKLRDHPLTTEVKEIMKSAEQGAVLTRQLLAFGRRQVLMPKVLNLNSLLHGMQDLLGRLIGEDIELTVACQPNLGLVKTDPGQMEQVILNLSLNARDAMPHGGKLMLETFNLNVTSVPGSQQPFGIPPGSYVVLRVSDTGNGMDETTLNRIFEPFFTTKKSGGSGLGLATVYGIVKQSNGHVNVQSELGVGTTFEIYLLKAAEEHSDISLLAPAPGPDDPRTILLVDDNEAVRQATAALLQARGFEVLQASNGLQAVDVSDRYDGPIHLLITDVVMPKMSGSSLAEEILRKRPKTKVLFMSGYSEEIVLGQNQKTAPAAATFLQKPFSMGTFIGRINELLDSRPSL